MGSHPITLDIGLILLVFGSSYGLTQIQHRLVQYPVILDGYPSNKMYLLKCYWRAEIGRGNCTVMHEARKVGQLLHIRSSPYCYVSVRGHYTWIL